MKVSFGLKPHSGWAALVVLGTDAGNLQVLDRRRIELVEDDGTEWAKQPYHAAEGKSSVEGALRQLGANKVHKKMVNF